MVKTFKQQKTNISAFTTSATATATAGILFSAFDDNPKPAYFALVTHGIDRHRLRIFNIRSGAVNNDYSSENKEKFTSLTWGNIADDKEHATENGKRRSRGTLQIVALGTHTGSVILYSLAHGSVVKRLANAHTTPVMDFVLNRAGTKGYSVAEDGYIVEWDIVHSKETGKWKVDEKHVRRLKLSHDETKLAVAGHTISLYSLKEWHVVKKYMGHASAVKELLFSFEDDVLISIAENDRYVNVWDAQASNNNTNNLTVLTMENNVSHVDFFQNEPSVLAVSEDGVLGIWQNAASMSNSSTFKSRRKAARAMTRQPETNIKIVSSQSEDTLIPIITAKFAVSDTGKSVIVARGSSVRPFFEVLNYIDESSGVPLQDIILTRKSVGNYLLDEQSKITSMNATRQRYDEETANVVGDSDLAVKQPMLNDVEAENEKKELSIEEKLRRMSEGDAQVKEHNKMESRPPKKSVPVPSAGSLQQALVQALHTNDGALLEACLRHSEPQIIRSTVQRLPTAYVIPFLQQLIERFQEKPARGRALMQWIKAILQVHTAYFMTVPDLINQLALFYQALDGRMKMFPRLLALKGRLDLIESQIDTRQRYAAGNDIDMEDESLANVYVEQDSDDEAESGHHETMASDLEAEDSEVELDGDMALEEDDDEEMVDAASEQDGEERDED